jgi:hypothetical protein
VGGAAKEAVGPGGAVTQTGGKVGAAVDDTGQAVGGAAEEVGVGAEETTDQVGQAAGQATQTGQGVGEGAVSQGDTGRRRARNGETKRGSKRGSKLGSRRSRSSGGDDEAGRGRVVRSAAKVGHLAQQTLGRLTGDSTRQTGGEATEQVGQAAGAAVQQIGSAAGAAVQQMGQAAAKATEQVGQAAVEASGKASWTPSKGEGARQGRRPASRRSGEGETKRGTRS